MRPCLSDRAILFEKPLKKPVTIGITPATATAANQPASLADYKGVAVFIETRDGAASDVSWN